MVDKDVSMETFAVLRQLRQAKIYHLGVAIMPQHEVLRLNVAVNDAGW
jgi:hypothetical protein